MNKSPLALLAVSVGAWACSDTLTEPIEIQASVSSAEIDPLYAGPAVLTAEPRDDLVLFAGWVQKPTSCAGFFRVASLDGRRLDAEIGWLPKGTGCEPGEAWYRIEAGFAVPGGHKYRVTATWQREQLVDTVVDVP